MKKIIKKITLVIFIIFALCSSSFSIEKTYTDKAISVVGDAYARVFETMVGYDNFKYLIFNDGLITDKQNVMEFQKFIVEDNSHFVLLCYDVSNFLNKLEPKKFESYLVDIINVLKRYDKNLFLYTFTDVSENIMLDTIHKAKDYDDIAKKMAKENDNVYYIDLSELLRLSNEKINLNDLYYDTLYSKLLYTVDEVDRVKYGNTTLWMKISDKYTLAVAGDSYAGTFARFEKDRDLNIAEFAVSNRTIIENDSIIGSAIDSPAKYILISTGVNDYERQTSLSLFEEELRRLFNRACRNDKIVFVHSYMNYGMAKTKNITIRDYDFVLKRVAGEYENAVYIDVGAYGIIKFQMQDLKHYDKEFNDKLYEFVSFLISSFEK